jgi:peptidase E
MTRESDIRAYAVAEGLTFDEALDMLRRADSVHFITEGARAAGEMYVGMAAGESIEQARLRCRAVLDVPFPDPFDTLFARSDDAMEKHADA